MAFLPLRRWAPLAFALLLASSPAVAASHYHRSNLVSDGGVPAAHVDPNLVNGWGVAFNPYGFAWVAAADGMVSTLYDGSGNIQPLVVQIPSPTMSMGGNPTGIVFNGSNNFVVSRNGLSGPARFIFATEQGVIAAWSPTVDATHALRVVNRSSTGTSYKGLAISGNGATQLLFAADFHHARVDVFDQNFHAVALPGAFTDPRLPAGFAPFGIQAIGGDIYVTYAKQDAAKEDEVAGPGLGVVDVYTPNGSFIRRIAAGGTLNAPWGIALAPAGFGDLSNKLLIGNFGDGRIHAYSPTAGIPLGPLTDSQGKPIRIDGLWGMQFGNGVSGQPVNTLFFAAGPDDESHGQYGRIDLIH
ncbi:MAG TPA: TIGR03118 family protein [Xanthomonadaceae bacterium]|nr:TIGR03118 family protein [Xanthomonadaceae bacterium]